MRNLALHTAPDVMQDVVAGYLEYRVVESVIQVIEFLDRVATCGVLHPCTSDSSRGQIVRPGRGTTRETANSSNLPAGSPLPEVAVGRIPERMRLDAGP